jgi:RHS repeat-associated protein
VAFYTTASGGGQAAHFEHQDWLGTERMRTSYNSGNNPAYAVEGTYTSLAWGDSQTTTSGADQDAYHFADIDYDSETNTDHAQFRQYSPTEGRWMRPDPYSGSYNLGNPQSLNRYTYAMNNPLGNIDPTGLDCARMTETGDVVFYSGDCPGYDPNNEYYIDCDGCTNGASYGWNGDNLIIGIGDNNGVTNITIDGVDYTPPSPNDGSPASVLTFLQSNQPINPGPNNQAPNNAPTSNKPPTPQQQQCIAQAKSYASKSRTILTVAGGVGLGDASAGCLLTIETGPGFLVCEGVVGALELTYEGVSEYGIYSREQNDIAQCMEN